jgi:hypothetical protein
MAMIKSMGVIYSNPAILRKMVRSIRMLYYNKTPREHRFDPDLE